MEREELDRLLAEYATGGLGEADRKRLFAAALEGGRLEARDESLTLLMSDESVVLLTESLPAAAAGYVSSDAGVAQLLRRQSELLGGPSKGVAGAAGSEVSEPSTGGTQ